MPLATDSGQDNQRLDKWLWAARLFKTRSLAAEAVNGGKVHVGGQRVKPARLIRPGLQIRVRKTNFEITVTVTALSKQRRPAPEARLLYTETEDSVLLREKKKVEAEQDRLRATRTPRPSKRDRRQINSAKRGNW